MPMLPALCNTGKLEYKQQILVNCVWVVGWEFIEIVNCHWHLSFAEHWQYNKLDHNRLRRIVSNGVNPNSSFTLAEPDSETDTDCMKFYCQWVSVSANTSMQFHTSHIPISVSVSVNAPWRTLGILTEYTWTWQILAKRGWTLPGSATSFITDLRGINRSAVSTECRLRSSLNPGGKWISSHAPPSAIPEFETEFKTQIERNVKIILFCGK